MDKFEKLVLEIITECEKDGEPVTRAEAEEMARMELSAKETRHYEKSDKPKAERKPKERKIDNEKEYLLGLLAECLEDKSISVEKENEVKLHFSYGGNQYSVTLTKHRK